MTERRSIRLRKAGRILRTPGVADAMAEIIIGHDHRCFGTLAVEQMLDMLGVSEAYFMERWSEGAYDAE